MVSHTTTDGFSLVELMVVVAVVGILAALAIPTFHKYLQRSRTSEADLVMDHMTQGAKSYFQSEQQGCDDPSRCAEPWHGSVDAGSPVPWTSYVFPGGNASLDTKGGNPPPRGGSKYEPQLSASNHRDALADALNMTSTQDKFYFKYVYQSSGSGGSASATVRARADFDPSTSDYHTHTQRLSIGDSGAVQTTQTSLKNEFE